MRLFWPIALLAVALLPACLPSPAVQEPTAAPSETPLPTPTASPTMTPSPDWTLVWADEFDGPDGSPVDARHWSFAMGAGGWGNGEWQYYTDRTENARIEQGRLVIEARKEEYKGNSYTSARLFSTGEASWKYGRFEARARLPIGQGIWPAIWMMPTGSVYGTWPASGEIDIVELIGKQPDRVHGTLHYGTPHTYKGSSYRLKNGQTFADDFHIFAIEWDPEEIRWYVDGERYHRTSEWFTSSSKGGPGAPFDQPFHFILNVAVGGVWPGFPDETTPFPARMEVDYVRVFEKSMK